MRGGVKESGKAARSGHPFLDPLTAESEPELERERKTRAGYAYTPLLLADIANVIIRIQQHIE